MAQAAGEGDPLGEGTDVLVAFDEEGTGAVEERARFGGALLACAQDLGVELRGVEFPVAGEGEVVAPGAEGGGGGAEAEDVGRAGGGGAGGGEEGGVDLDADFVGEGEEG